MLRVFFRKEPTKIYRSNRLLPSLRIAHFVPLEGRFDIKHYVVNNKIIYHSVINQPACYVSH